MTGVALTYPVVIEPEHADGPLFVTARDFPEITTFGRTVDDALLMAADALMTALELRAAKHEVIPKASTRRPGEFSVMPTWVYDKASPEKRAEILLVIKQHSNIEDPKHGYE